MATLTYRRRCDIAYPCAYFRRCVRRGRMATCERAPSFAPQEKPNREGAFPTYWVDNGVLRASETARWHYISQG